MVKQHSQPEIVLASHPRPRHECLASSRTSSSGDLAMALCRPIFVPASIPRSSRLRRRTRRVLLGVVAAALFVTAARAELVDTQTNPSGIIVITPLDSDSGSIGWVANRGSSSVTMIDRDTLATATIP